MQSPRWVYPDTVQSALTELNRPGSMPVAGGTTIVDLLKLGHPIPERLIDLSRLPLKAIEDRDDSIMLGGGVSNTDAAYSAVVRRSFPAVSEAILSGATQQIRNAATIAGNLLQATRCLYFRDPRWACNRRIAGSGCSAIEAPQPGHAVLGVSSQCIAVHPSDLSVALAALDAVVIGETPKGTLRVPIAAFYKRPDDERARDCTWTSDSLITGVELPKSRLASRSGYLKLRHRASYEFSSAAVAAALLLEDGVVKHFSMALGGIATMPWRNLDAERHLIGKPLTVDSIDQLCDRVLDGAVTSSSTDYKIGLARGGIHRLLDRLAAAQRGT
ncbi:FAD binding domain-containing protein [Mesorhizobium sp. 1B3]|uniref:FAD binding domain-containing protein n=1 Tax=Mesorhizobium sp. 1B3 TaxID=3243599 RepID=UPI003D971BE3